MENKKTFLNGHFRLALRAEEHFVQCLSGFKHYSYSSEFDNYRLSKGKMF